MSEISKAAFDRCQQSETQRTHLDIFLASTAAYMSQHNRAYFLFMFFYIVYSGGQSTQIKYLSKSTDMYNKILLH